MCHFLQLLNPYHLLLSWIISYVLRVVVACSLQNLGNTAFIMSSQMGHTDVALALMAHPGINVNLANVRIYLLTPSHVVSCFPPLLTYPPFLFLPPTPPLLLSYVLLLLGWSLSNVSQYSAYHVQSTGSHCCGPRVDGPSQYRRQPTRCKKNYNSLPARPLLPHYDALDYHS